MLPYWENGDFIFINVFLVPKTKMRKICKELVNVNDKVFVKIYVKAMPKEGKANDDLIDFLNEELKIKKLGGFSLVRGKKSKKKVVKIASSSLEIKDVERWLNDGGVVC